MEIMRGLLDQDELKIAIMLIGLPDRRRSFVSAAQSLWMTT
jgi:hypothetical protein